MRLVGDTVRVPDVAVLRNPDLTATIFDRVALFLAVEIADTSLSIDLGDKLHDYAEAFVPHYWVVNLARRETVVMSEPRGGSYEASRRVPFGQTIILPGVEAGITVD